MALEHDLTPGNLPEEKRATFLAAYPSSWDSAPALGFPHHVLFQSECLQAGYVGYVKSRRNSRGSEVDRCVQNAKMIKDGLKMCKDVCRA